MTAGASSRAVSGVVLRPLACWDRGFESHRGTWMFVCCECYVLSGRGLCDELITRPEESYRLWCVVVCVIKKPQKWGGHGPRWASAPQKNKTKKKPQIIKGDPHYRQHDGSKPHLTTKHKLIEHRVICAIASEVEPTRRQPHSLCQICRNQARKFRGGELVVRNRWSQNGQIMSVRSANAHNLLSLTRRLHSFS